MSRCYALKYDRSPCRNYASVLKRTSDHILYAPTCHYHTHFFEDWENGEHREINYIYIEHFEGMYPFTERILRDGVVDVSKRDIERIDMRTLETSQKDAYYAQFILLCAKYVEGFESSWNDELVNATLRTLWWQSRAIGPVPVTFNDILLLSNTITDPIERFYRVFSNFPARTNIQPTQEHGSKFVR
jgi:hypothetical protein